jgi:hypothetical protein
MGVADGLSRLPSALTTTFKNDDYDNTAMDMTSPNVPAMRIEPVKWTQQTAKMAPTQDNWAR